MNGHGKGRVLRLLVMTLGLLVVLGLAAPPVHAADFRSSETVIISADEVIDDDLFVSGNYVEMNGTIRGDLFASGNEVVINGHVEGSLGVGGTEVVINGTVDGSVYGGAYLLTIGPEARITRNAFVGAFSVTTAPESVIGRDLYAGAYQVALNGEIGRNAEIGAGALEVTGVIGGDLRGEVSDAEQGAQPPTIFFPGQPQVDVMPPGLRVQDEAQIGGEVDVTLTTATATAAAAAPESAVVGLLRARIGEWIALLVTGLVFLFVGPTLLARAGEAVQARPLPSAGWGLVGVLIFAFLVPVVALAVIALAVVGGTISFGRLFPAFLTLGGAGLLFAVAFCLVVVLWVTKVVVGFLVGEWLMARAAPQATPSRTMQIVALAIGLLLYEVLRAIPFFGPLVALAVMLVGLGALYLALRGDVRPVPAPRPVVSEMPA